MSKVKYNVAQTLGSFKNEAGEKKYNYLNLGVVIEKENGHLSLKLNALPLPNEKGEVWVNLYPVEREY